VRSRVANITEFLPANPPNIMEFRQMIINGVFGDSKVEEYRLTEEDWQNIHQLSQERYHNWDWNYGKSPAFAIKRETRYVGGTIEAWIDIGRGGIIENICFYGDFFGQRDVAELENSLKNTPYEPQALRQVLSEININDYFVNITLDDLLYLLY
jgi:lipoate-protein ligase A